MARAGVGLRNWWLRSVTVLVIAAVFPGSFAATARAAASPALA
jgi:hypothetical protein